MRIGIILAGLILLAWPAAAQVELRYQWRTGDAFLLDKVLDLAGTIRSGTAPPVETSQSAKIRKKVSVEEIDPDGWARLSVALLSVSATKRVTDRAICCGPADVESPRLRPTASTLTRCRMIRLMVSSCWARLTRMTTMTST